MDVPVTLAWGERDRLIKARDPGIPGARTVTLEGCGHVPTWDDPEQVTQVILQTAGVLAATVLTAGESFAREVLSLLSAVAIRVS